MKKNLIFRLFLTVIVLTICSVFFNKYPWITSIIALIVPILILGKMNTYHDFVGEYYFIVAEYRTIITMIIIGIIVSSFSNYNLLDLLFSSMPLSLGIFSTSYLFIQQFFIFKQKQINDPVEVLWRFYSEEN